MWLPEEVGLANGSRSWPDRIFQEGGCRSGLSRSSGCSPEKASCSLTGKRSVGVPERCRPPKVLLRQERATKNKGGFQFLSEDTLSVPNPSQAWPQAFRQGQRFRSKQKEPEKAESSLGRRLLSRQFLLRPFGVLELVSPQREER